MRTILLCLFISNLLLILNWVVFLLVNQTSGAIVELKTAPFAFVQIVSRHVLLVEMFTQLSLKKKKNEKNC